jgi:para-nitrobenzyl esterase
MKSENDNNGRVKDGLNRRNVLGGSLVVAAATVAVSPAKSQTPPPSLPPSNSRSIHAGQSREIFCTAETISGRVQGLVTSGIKTFKGVPYGASTAGANRFMPPRKPTPWRGVHDACGFGQVSPQMPLIYSDYVMMTMWDRHSGDSRMGEDMLNLNIWTPGVADGGKRAVLVSFHGGGWQFGSGNGLMYDGTNLAQLGDVVVVTVNHRLSALGTTDLSTIGGAGFEAGGACGLMDLVAALEWVRDNIAAFGGDPGRVMIFGQSGGGLKTSTLLGIPSAKGLFHRAAIQSGSGLRVQSREEAAKTAELVVAELGLTRSTLSDIRKLPWASILQAQAGAMAKGANFSAGLVGSEFLPRHPFDPNAPAESIDVPVIISSTREDAATRLTNFDLTREDLRRELSKMAPGRGDEVTDVYLKANPNRSPFQIQAQALSDTTFLKNAVRQAELRVAAGRGAPTWMYLWEWATPAYDGKFGAVHGHDVDASFYNIRSPICGAGDAAGKLMSRRLAETWIAFAKTGNPNNAHVPDWPAFDLKDRKTMVFDTEMRAESDPRGPFRALWA